MEPKVIQKSIVRPLTDADLDEASDVFTRAFSEVWAQRGRSWPEGIGRAYLEINHDLDPESGVVAETHSQIVGLCYSHPRGRTAGIGPMAVVPEAWSSGVASEMLEVLLARPETAAADSVRLLVSSWNERAIAFYARYGFAAASTIGLFTLETVPRMAPRPARAVSRLTGSETDSCVQLDKWATGAERSKDFRFLADRGAFVLCKDVNEGAIAFAAAYPAATEGEGTFVGPIVAADLDGFWRVLAAVTELNDDALPLPLSVRVSLTSPQLMAGLLDVRARLMNVELLLVRGATTFDEDALVGFAMLPESN